MAQLISEIWAGLRDAGIPEVMLYLEDNTASRCHWDDTAVINDVRVALLADQDRKIVRILPVDTCSGIGVASPKGIDPSGYKAHVQGKLRERFGDPNGSTGTASADATASDSSAETLPDASPAGSGLPAWFTTDPSPEPAPVAMAEPKGKPAPAVSRFGLAMKSAANSGHGATG